VKNQRIIYMKKNLFFFTLTPLSKNGSRAPEEFGLKTTAVYLGRIEFFEQRLGAVVASDGRQEEAVGVDVVGEDVFGAELRRRRPGDDEARA